MHDLLVISVPSLMVMFGILLNRQESYAIRAEINQLRSDSKSDMSQLRAELKGDHDRLRTEIITLRDNIHHDMLGLHERVAVVEDKHRS